jgi:hypothetical protein
MRKIGLFLIITSMLFATDLGQITLPNRFPSTVIRKSEHLQNLDTIVSKYNRTLTTLENEFMRFGDFPDSTIHAIKVDTLKSNTVIDTPTINAPTIYNASIRSGNSKVTNDTSTIAVIGTLNSTTSNIGASSGGIHTGDSIRIVNGASINRLTATTSNIGLSQGTTHTGDSIYLNNALKAKRVRADSATILKISVDTLKSNPVIDTGVLNAPTIYNVNIKSGNSKVTNDTSTNSKVNNLVVDSVVAGTSKFRNGVIISDSLRGNKISFDTVKQKESNFYTKSNNSKINITSDSLGRGYSGTGIYGSNSLRIGELIGYDTNYSYSPARKDIELYSSNGDVVLAFSGGNNKVGVGKMNPSTMLDVAGGIKSDSIQLGSGSQLKEYIDMTFTVTLTGFTTTVTGTARAIKIGKSVTLYIPSMTGTSNSSIMEITGIPTYLRPHEEIYHCTGSCVVVDNSDLYGGILEYVGAGYFDFLWESSGGNILSLGNFTASGTKGVYSFYINYISQ